MDTYEIGSLIRNANAGLNSAARLLDSAENRGVKDEVEDGIKEIWGGGKEGEGPKQVGIPLTVSMSILMQRKIGETNIEFLIPGRRKQGHHGWQRG